MALLSFLDRERSIAGEHYPRWLVPPAALSIHLSIGQAYAFSVFNFPLSQRIGVTHSAPADWKLSTIGWVFSVAIVFLGLSAALFGSWLDRVGPRKAMFVAALCFGGGLGIGYMSPVTTLIRWFPDRPGMATGMAIMGFGGGAMIASPLSTMLMAYFKTDQVPGAAATFVTLGILYFCFMMFGVFTVRIPRPGWQPRGWMPSERPKKMVTTENVTANLAIRTPQFWLLWVMLCMNVTAGIGVLGQASPMIQEMFPGSISVAAAAGFVGLLSLANMIGRFFWSSLSDYIGRKAVYATFFALGAVLYAAVPSTGRA